MKKFISVIFAVSFGFSLLYASQLVFTQGQDTSTVSDASGKVLTGFQEISDGLYSVETHDNTASFEYNGLSVSLTDNAKASVDGNVVVLSYGGLMVDNSSENDAVLVAEDSSVQVKPGTVAMLFARRSDNRGSVISPAKSTDMAKNTETKTALTRKQNTDQSYRPTGGIGTAALASSGLGSSSSKTESINQTTGMKFSGINQNPESVKSLEPAAGDGVVSVPEKDFQDKQKIEQEDNNTVKILPPGKNATIYAEYNKAYFGLNLNARLNFVSTTGDKVGKDLLEMLKKTYWSVSPFFGIGGFKMGLRFNSTAVNYFWFTKDKNWRDKTNAVFNIIDDISFTTRKGGFSVALDRTTEFGFKHVMDSRLSRNFDFAYSDDLYSGKGLDLRNESTMALSLKGRTDFIDCDLYADTINFARSDNLMYGGARVGVRPTYLSRLEFGISTMFDIYKKYNSEYESEKYSPQFYPSLDFFIPFAEGGNAEHFVVGSVALDVSSEKGKRGFAGQLGYRAEWEKFSLEANITANVKEMLSRALDNSRYLTENVTSRTYTGFTILDSALKFGYSGKKTKIDFSAIVPFMVGNRTGIYREGIGTDNESDDNKSLDRFALECLVDFSDVISMNVGIAENGIIGRLKNGQGARAIFNGNKDSNIFVGLNFNFGAFKLDTKIAYAQTTLDDYSLKDGVYVTVGGKYTFGGRKSSQISTSI